MVAGRTNGSGVRVALRLTARAGCLALLVTCLAGLALAPAWAMAGEPAAGDTPATAPAKHPPPDAAARARALQAFDEIYKDDLAGARGTEEKAALAGQILRSASTTQDDADVQFVALEAARDLAVKVGEVDAALGAINELDKRFQIDAPPMRVKAIRDLMKTTRRHDRLIERIDQLIDDAIQDDQFEPARQLAELAAGAARVSRNVGAIRQAEAWARDVKEMAGGFAQLKPALAKLADRPEDPEANLAAGGFYCFTKGDWDKGLPLLARSGEEIMQSLARMDLAQPAEPEKMVELADLLWRASDKQTGLARGQIRLRAGRWYAQAMPELTGLTRAKAQKRLAEMEKTVPPHLLARMGAARVRGLFRFPDQKTAARDWEIGPRAAVERDGLRLSVGGGSLKSLKSFRGDIKVMIDCTAGRAPVLVGLWGETFDCGQPMKGVVLERSGDQVAIAIDGQRPKLSTLKPANREAVTPLSIVFCPGRFLVVGTPPSLLIRGIMLDAVSAAPPKPNTAAPASK